MYLCTSRTRMQLGENHLSTCYSDCDFRFHTISITLETLEIQDLEPQSRVHILPTSHGIQMHINVQEALVWVHFIPGTTEEMFQALIAN